MWCSSLGNKVFVVRRKALDFFRLSTTAAQTIFVGVIAACADRKVLDGAVRCSMMVARRTSFVDMLRRHHVV